MAAISSIAFPLRLENSFLRRCGPEEAVVSLIRVMATTPHGSWAGGRHFGIRDLCTQARTRSEVPQEVVQELNRALEELGITSYCVQSIAKEPQSSRDVDSYVIEIVSVSDGSRVETVRVEG